MTLSDCLVACKYFLLADTDYDRRFMRGKLKVIYNEGFKRLYGFTEKSKNESQWFRLKPIIAFFPKDVNAQFLKMTDLLEEQSIASNWWKDERNLEVHMYAEELYKSTQVEVIESKVMTESLELFNALYAVNLFVGNAHSFIFNYILAKYHRGELKVE